tara:strand:- start:270 stop:548 length:279 start_codon:yes stop_codon:yes gene_type:complete
MIKMRVIGKPYNHHVAVVATVDWEAIRSAHENPDKTIIWVKEDDGVHYGHIDCDGRLLQMPPRYATTVTEHISTQYRESVLRTAAEPAKLID